MMSVRAMQVSVGVCPRFTMLLGMLTYFWQALIFKYYDIINLITLMDESVL